MANCKVCYFVWFVCLSGFTCLCSGPSSTVIESNFCLTIVLPAYGNQDVCKEEEEKKTRQITKLPFLCLVHLLTQYLFWVYSNFCVNSFLLNILKLFWVPSNEPIYVVKSHFWVCLKNWVNLKKYLSCHKYLSILKTNFELADGLGIS